MDHGSDAFFVTFTIAALTHHEWAPVVLVCIIPAAFVQYMLDSKALAGQPLKASSLGKYNGISYFVFAGFPVMQLALGITLIPFELVRLDRLGPCSHQRNQHGGPARYFTIQQATNQRIKRAGRRITPG